MNDAMTLPISQQGFWTAATLIGFLALSALIYWVLSRMGKDHRPPIWEELREGWQGPTILLGLLWLGLFGLTIAAAYVGVWQAIRPEGQAVQPGLGLGALLAALLGAPFLIWGTWLKYQTVRYQKEGHITDRINKAVEQLGAEKTVKVRGTDADGKDITIEETKPNIEVRIGAILSLERIAQDSTSHDKGRDHVRVMEILCAYVRENAPAANAKNSLRQDWDRECEAWDDDPSRLEVWFCDKYHVHPLDIDEATSVNAARLWAAGLRKPRADIQMVLHVIGRRTADQRRVEAAWPNLPDQDTIWPFDLPYPRLPDRPSNPTLTPQGLAEFGKRVDIWKRHISTYSGYQLDLRSTNLQATDLSAKRPDASDAVFSGALLNDARIDGANLGCARVEGANLSNVSLIGADLERMRAEGTHLIDAQIEGADLTFTRLQGAYLACARMKGALLLGTRLEAANLSSVQLEGVDLRKANIAGAAVSDTDLTKLNVTLEQVVALFGDASVRLPSGIPRPAHWPICKLHPFGEPDFDKEWAKWLADPKGYVPPAPPEAK